MKVSMSSMMSLEQGEEWRWLMVRLWLYVITTAVDNNRLSSRPRSLRALEDDPNRTR